MSTTTTLTNVHLVTSGELVDIAMTDGRITRITPVVEVEESDDTASDEEPGQASADTGAASGGDVVDGLGGYVMPGLIDTHLHLLDESELATLTDFGVTSAVELGTHPDSLIEELRAAQGVTTFLSAGSAASAPGGTQTAVIGFPAESAVTGPDDAERFVAWRHDAGADVIKIIIEDPNHPTAKALDLETITAIVEAAHKRDLLTFAHVVTAHSYTMGLDAGVDILTHTPLDRPLDDDTVERLVKAGTIVSPTLVMMKAAAEAFAGREDRGPNLSLDNALESVRRMHEAGVTILAGTDANLHPKTPAQIPMGTSLHEELELLVEAGLTPTEALTAATSAAATAVRLEDRGVLEPGKRADLVVLGTDPRSDVTASRSVAQVWIAGERVR